MKKITFCNCYVIIIVINFSYYQGLDVKRYEGYQLIQVIPESESQLWFLRRLMQSHDQIDFWTEPYTLHRKIEILVGPAEIGRVKAAMKNNSINIQVIDENVQKNLDKARVKRDNRPHNSAYDWNEYNTYENYMAELELLAADCRADVRLTCSVSVIGYSFERREIKLLKIDTGAEKDFWIDSCIHAREWLACATVMKIVDHLIRKSPTDEEAKRILYRYNWHIVPIFNVDGYIFTSIDRFWRKSRNVNLDNTCIGTDLNRNHDALWNTLGSSSNPCSIIYHGSGPSSEPEVQAIEAAARAIGDTLEVFISFHSYGYYWLWSYGNCSDPANIANIARVGNATCDGIKSVYGDPWACGNGCLLLYAIGGSTIDWAIEKLNVPYAYLPEVRGEGFDAPPSYIEYSFREIWAGLVALVDEIGGNEMDNDEISNDESGNDKIVDDEIGDDSEVAGLKLKNWQIVGITLLVLCVFCVIVAVGLAAKLIMFRKKEKVVLSEETEKRTHQDVRKTDGVNVKNEKRYQVSLREEAETRSHPDVPKKHSLNVIHQKKPVELSISPRNSLSSEQTDNLSYSTSL